MSKKPVGLKDFKTEMVAVADLIPYVNNPKAHPAGQVDKIASSIKNFGFLVPLVVDGGNEIVAGHGRYEAAQKLGLGVVPCVRADNLTPGEVRLFRIADNRTAESAWFPESLALELKALEEMDFDLGLTGFDLDELEEMGIGAGNDPSPEDPGPQIDRAAELQEKWGTKRGQIWQVGRHRVTCGDSNKQSDVNLLLGNNKPDTLIFDPEWDQMNGIIKYNCEYYKSVLAFTDARRIGESIKIFGIPTWLFVWDAQACWYTPNRPLQRAKYCLWYGDITKYNFDGAHYGEPLESKTVSNTRGTYNYKSDPRGKHLADIYCEQLTKVHKESGHSHSKPLDWMRCLIGCCGIGDVFDPFLGSGASLAACEKLDRICYGIEINPAFIAVALDLAEQMGLQPELL
jgi:hypothetical protein